VKAPAGVHILPAWRRKPFSSALQAQRSYELRRNGMLLPMIIGGWSLLCLGLFLLDRDFPLPSLLFFNTTYFVVLMSVLVGTLLGKPDVWSRQMQLPATLATRPLRSGDIVIAKYQAAAQSLLVCWVVLAFAAYAGTLLGGYREEWSRAWYHLNEVFSLSQVILFLTCVAIGLFGFSWLYLAGNQTASLTGRVWTFAGLLVFYLAGLPNLAVLRSELQEKYPQLYQQALPVLLYLAVLVKFQVAAWGFWTSWRRGLIGVQAIVIIAGVWCAIVLSLLSAIMLEGQANFSHLSTYLLLGLILACPLARLAVAPLALAWNRHR
jgi:hypothetical protein